VRFTFIGNACGIFESSAGARLLCDPWIVDGVFEGSWFHYPPLRTTVDDLQNVDCIYVSHLHPDHYDQRAFDFPRSTPVIVLDSKTPYLCRLLERKGFENIVPIASGDERQICTFNLRVFEPFCRHNFHDSEIGSLIDSALLVSADGQMALNSNDNTPTPETGTEFQQRFGKLDLLMLNYNAAGPYPSCFSNLTTEQKRSESRRIIERNIAYGIDVIRAFAPRAVLPFAGSYVLGGRLAPKNEYLGTTSWDEPAERWGAAESDVITLVMQEGQSLELGTLSLDSEYEPIDPAARDAYIQSISGAPYDYDEEPPAEPAEIIDLLHEATGAMARRMDALAFPPLEWNVYIEVERTLVRVLPDFALVEQADDPQLRCSLDLRLLRRILLRQSHWNNAEIGAHIEMFRQPNTFLPDLHTALQLLHV